jgi:hypothetical protein
MILMMVNLSVYLINWIIVVVIILLILEGMVF